MALPLRTNDALEVLVAEVLEATSWNSFVALPLRTNDALESLVAEVLEALVAEVLEATNYECLVSDTQQEKNKNPFVEGQGVVYTYFLSYNEGVNTREVH